MNQLTLLFLLTFLGLSSWYQEKYQPDADEYKTGIRKWHQERIKGLTAPNGWLSLAGLYWLKEGANTFGSSEHNNLRFPAKMPAEMGSILLKNDKIFVEAETEVGLSMEGELVTRAELTPLSGSPAKTIHWLSVNFHIIKRGERYGVRLRDTLKATRLHFDSIPYFPIDPLWKVSAALTPPQSGDSIAVGNVLGMKFQMKPAGTLHFEIDQQPYSLVVLDGGLESYFLIFFDQTSGVETYGGGRYASIPKADSTGQINLDFNKAYNPPCAFTDFATCLLPPKQNKLPISILAGEKVTEHH